MKKWQYSFVLLGLAIIVGLPIAGSLARRNRKERCALDGVKIEAIYRVRIVEDQSQARSFCCIRCAEFWVERRDFPPQAVYVTDEVTRREIDSQLAYFVRSSVVASPATRNRIHVFQNLADALKHANTHKGRILTDSEKPFSRKE